MKRILSVVVLTTIAAGLSLGAAQPKVDLTKKEVKILTATAKTPAEHLKLAQYYDQRANAYLAESKKHEEMAEASRKNRMAGSKFFHMSVQHCESLASSYRENAQKMKGIADDHRAMADKAGM